MSLVLSVSTNQAITQFIANPAHAVVIAGPIGSGKQAIAVQIAEGLLQKNFENYPYKLVIEPEAGKAIGIESIREIEHLLSLRVPTNTQVNRVVLIHDAHQLSREAQNALLKTLEEPPAGTLLMLTSDSIQSLLPTVRSRVQVLPVQVPTQEQLLAHYQAEGHAATDITRAYSMTGGLPGLMQAILTEQDHPLRVATETARAILGESSYDRMLRVDTLSKDKALTGNVLFILQQMAHVSLKSAQGPAAARWKTVLTNAYDASQALSQSAQPKLVLSKLMLTL